MNHHNLEIMKIIKEAAKTILSFYGPFNTIHIRHTQEGWNIVWPKGYGVERVPLIIHLIEDPLMKIELPYDVEFRCSFIERRKDNLFPSSDDRRLIYCSYSDQNSQWDNGCSVECVKTPTGWEFTDEYWYSINDDVPVTMDHVEVKSEINDAPLKELIIH